ncbi:DUF2490 domain-containing protein [Winogradskyella sp. A2]|uniref:DUF2490 domain-containing protein n=1 Tax=Winogradskyella sp. A2 TaxID=3366944 RepID=UPI00398C76F9
MKSTLHILLITLLFHINLSAQNTGESELGSFYEISLSNRITNKLSISGFFTNWNYELSTENPQLILGIVGLNYHINKNVTVGIGYANGVIDTSFEINDVTNISENRILEQIVLKHKLNSIGLSHRFKLEQRFLEFPTENILKHRIRYRFKSNISINKTLFVSIYDEIHFNLNEFDFQQNRAYAGLGGNLNKNINVQLGYLRHSFKTNNFNRISLQLNFNYDFRKEKTTQL